MTLNQLYYFRTAAGQLNFHRTAEQLMISQPSLSAAIASLERELGVPLFLRKGRHLELSKYGLLYFKEVDALLGRLDSVNATLKRAARPGQGHIDVGYIAPLSPKFMPETVRAFLQQPGYEQVTFGFRELPTRELLDGLKTFLYDVVFCIYEEGEPEGGVRPPAGPGAGGHRAAGPSAGCGGPDPAQSARPLPLYHLYAPCPDLPGYHGVHLPERLDASGILQCHRRGQHLLSGGPAASESPSWPKRMCWTTAK